VLISYLKKTNIVFDWFARDLNLYWIKIVYLKHKITIRCSYKIIPISVKKMGEIIGIKKVNFPHRFVNFENLNYNGPSPEKKFFDTEEDYLFFTNKNFNLKELAISYCFTDVEIVHDVLVNIIKILKNYDKNILRSSYSFASIAYKIYIKKFDKFYISKNTPKIFENNYYRNAYYGGRCEVFGNPVENEIIHYFDFKGMYAQCMLQKFPTKEPVLKEKNLSINKIGFHTIKFKCDTDIPFLPYKANKLFFPNGIITGTYWYEEILNAINYHKCEILEHYSSIEFEAEDFIFKDYVHEFMTVRTKGGFFDLFGKNMINGLYGSFALKDDFFFTIIVLNETEFNSITGLMDIAKWKKYDNIYVIDIIKNSKSKAFFNKKNKWNQNESKRNIAYSAVIAAKARIKLNNALDETTRNGGRIFYTDTDSIFAGFKKSYLNQKMGEIRWTSTYEDAVFVSSKFYQIKTHDLKLKGASANNYDFQTLKTDFYANKLFINLENQFNVRKKDYNFFLTHVNKTIKLSMYDKRSFNSTKTKTTPIWIE
jgi:hypothetical protein